MKLSIGLVYDLRTDYLREGYSEREVAEFDFDDTIDILHQTIAGLGYDVERIGHGRLLCTALASGKRWNLVFNIAEGLCGRCREAQVPAILELYGIPYTFSDPLVCAATLDKSIAKKLVCLAGLPTPAFAVVESHEDIGKISIGFPLFAKPLAEGTSKGVDHRSVIQNMQQLRQICTELLDTHRQPVLVEEYLPGREFTVGILGTGPDARVLGIVEIIVVAENEPAVYSYINKEDCESRIIYRPFKEDLPLKDRIGRLALDCYRLLQCRDAARVDIRCNSSGDPSFLEVNPLPGLHPVHSDLPIIATGHGMEYPQLIESIIKSALQRTKNRCR